MYLRFVSPARVSARGYHSGLFRGAAAVLDSYDYPEFLRGPLREEYNWFRDNLTAPEWDVWYRGQRDSGMALCWFRAEAHEMISHAFTMAILLRECGVFISTISTSSPGHIWYRDDHQIVARPGRFTPTAWG